MKLSGKGDDLLVEVGITWFGHSMFLFENPQLRLLVDPFGESVGYPLPEVDADVVLVSHDHYDHNNVSLLKNVDHIDKNDLPAFLGTSKIEGCSSFHDECGGAKRGDNTIYKWNMSGITFVHMGDYGESGLTRQQLEFMQGASVLMIPVGGVYTVGAAEAVQIINQVSPAVAIPMHYKTKYCNLQIDEIHPFLSMIESFKYCSSSVSLSPLSLPENTEIWIFEPLD